MSEVDYFLKIDGITGESQDIQHGGEIQISSFSWGQRRDAAGEGGARAGRFAVVDFKFVKNVCVASPKLIMACARNQRIKSAVLTARKAGKGQQDYLKITFEDVLVSSYQLDGASKLPADSINLNFAKISVDYQKQDAQGQMSPGAMVSYDLRQTPQ
jgi:type VI secretion system secreted protein Hcp